MTTVCVHGIEGLCSACLEHDFASLVADVTVVHRTTVRTSDGMRHECVDDDGRLHDDGLEPAVVETDADGNVIFEAHYLNGVAGDVAGEPAALWLYANGRPRRVHHMHNGRLHDRIRTDGSLIPAVVELGVSGAVVRAESWRDGRMHRTL